MLVLTGSTIDLVNSLFDLNFDANDNSTGIGIVNMGGDVQCDTNHCLQVCTVCIDGRGSPSPTPHPAAVTPPTPHPTAATSPTSNKWGVTETAVFAISAAFVAAFVVAVAVVLAAWRRHGNISDVMGVEDCSEPDAATMTGAATLTSDLLGDARNPPDPHVSFALLQSSRAAVFVVDRAMRVKLWSTGKQCSESEVLNLITHIH